MSNGKAASMTKSEALLLIQLVESNQVVTSKPMNAANNKLKEEAWCRICTKFNAAAISGPRTAAQLRLKWENLKKSARKRTANICNSYDKNAVVKACFPPHDVLDRVTSLLDASCQGHTEFSGDESIVNNESNATERASVFIESFDEGNSNVSSTSTKETIQMGDVLSTPTKSEWKFFDSSYSTLGKHKYKLRHEEIKSRTHRNYAIADYFIVKKKKIDLDIDEKILIIEKFKLENLKLKLEIEKLHSNN